MQVWVAYYTEWSKHSHHAGQSNPLCDVPQGDKIGGGKLQSIKEKHVQRVIRAQNGAAVGQGALGLVR